MMMLGDCRMENLPQMTNGTMLPNSLKKLRAIAVICLRLLHLHLDERLQPYTRLLVQPLNTSATLLQAVVKEDVNVERLPCRVVKLEPLRAPRFTHKTRKRLFARWRRPPCSFNPLHCLQELLQTGLEGRYEFLYGVTSEKIRVRPR